MQTLKSEKIKILKQATIRNHWMLLFIKAITKAYSDESARITIRNCATDMFAHGFNHARRYWWKLMAFHYGENINDDDYLIKMAMMKRNRGLGILGFKQARSRQW